MFDNIYAGKKVLVTGNTGFKGSWLTCWLLKLGAEVVGLSKDIPTNPSMYDDLKIKKKINHYTCDIRNLENLKSIILDEKPDFIFHLAAQPIVSISYKKPLETITANTLGTANLMEVLRNIESNIVLVLITSDKSYDNVEWVWGYKETDKVGGKDIYSGSKGAAELIIKSYFHSFFNKKDHPVKVGIGRAGNVIGGGDWALDRIIVDAVKAWSKNNSVQIRCPNATRPWQHVLEPLSGYLSLGHSLHKNGNNNGEAYNFGPRAEQNRTVIDLLDTMKEFWSYKIPNETYKITDNIPFEEAGLLKLNCDKALSHLKWEAVLDYKKTIEFTSDWYSKYFKNEENLFELTINQIEAYNLLAKDRGLIWTK